MDVVAVEFKALCINLLEQARETTRNLADGSQYCG